MTAAIQIKRADVADDIRKLADLMGTSLTDAIASAVRAQLAVEQIKADSTLRKRRERAERLVAQLRSLPVHGPLLSDRDLYDDEGMPK